MTPPRIVERSLGCRDKKSAENGLRLHLELLILTLAAFQCFASRSAALPVVENAGQYTERFLPTLSNTLIPPGDHLQIFAVVNTSDPEGSPTIGVTAKQGDTIITLEHIEGLSFPENFYWKFIDFDPRLAGAWEIIPRDSTGTGSSAFIDALGEPELLPYVESITPQGSPLGASVEWTLPELTDFDVEFVQVRIVQVMPRGEVFFTDFPFPATSFEPPSGILEYGVEYVYNIELHDVGPFTTENRSTTQSQPFRYVLPGDFNLDGAVDAADYIVWRKNFNGDPAKYDVWRSNFGSSLGPGSGSALPSAEPLSDAVPEPTTLVLLIIAAALGLHRHARPTRYCFYEVP